MSAQAHTNPPQAFIVVSATNHAPIDVQVHGINSAEPPPINNRIVIFEQLRQQLINATAQAVTELDKQIDEWKVEAKR